MSAIPLSRREQIVRFLQQSVAVSFVVWLAVIFNRRGELIALPTHEALGLTGGWLISAVPFGMMLTAFGWAFRAVLRWVLRK